MVEREYRQSPVAFEVRRRRPLGSASSTRARELLRFDAWNARIDEELAAIGSSRSRPLPRKQLDLLCAAHIVVKRLVCHISEVPSTQDSQDLERAWRDLERAWAAVRTTLHPEP